MGTDFVNDCSSCCNQTIGKEREKEIQNPNIISKCIPQTLKYGTLTQDTLGKNDMYNKYSPDRYLKSGNFSNINYNVLSNHFNNYIENNSISACDILTSKNTYEKMCNGERIHQLMEPLSIYSRN